MDTVFLTHPERARESDAETFDNILLCRLRIHIDNSVVRDVPEISTEVCMPMERSGSLCPCLPAPHTVLSIYYERLLHSNRLYMLRCICGQVCAIVLSNSPGILSGTAAFLSRSESAAFDISSSLNSRMLRKVFGFPNPFGIRF